MRKAGLAMLLLVCFLISLPVAASDLESVEVQSLMNFVQPPEITINSFPEEITIIQRGEVPVLSLLDSETIIYDVINFDIPLLEFQIDSGGNHTLYGDDGYILNPKTFISVNTIPPEREGGADLFCFIQHSDIPLLI